MLAVTAMVDGAAPCAGWSVIQDGADARHSPSAVATRKLNGANSAATLPAKHKTSPSTLKGPKAQPRNARVTALTSSFTVTRSFPSLSKDAHCVTAA